MKTISSFLLGILLLLFGVSTAFAAPACGRPNATNACKTAQKKAQSRNQMDRTQKRSLRRQHTREAYDRHDMTDSRSKGEDAPRFHKGKKMTLDERNRLRQQIDEVGQAIYHQ